MPGVAVVSVPVTDQDRAAAFYATYLGLPRHRGHAHGSERCAGCSSAAGDERDDAHAHDLVRDDDAAGSVQGLVIDVDDVDATRAPLVAAGVECSELDDQPWGRYFTATDPDGNGLVVAKTTPRAHLRPERAQARRRP